ncbi:MAG: hypothetical protein CM1200mP39_04460 [Dehalococcoidia bacterium]|nr:MAG: hypothetical protein CM1200mP39_04460 [Dehalococcoidia bacterium]
MEKTLLLPRIPPGYNLSSFPHSYFDYFEQSRPLTIEITDPNRNVTGNYHWKVFWTVAIALFAMVMDFSIVFPFPFVYC